MLGSIICVVSVVVIVMSNLIVIGVVIVSDIGIDLVLLVL